MTSLDSICVKCIHLNCFLNAYVGSGDKIALISECAYGGQNAGNRKTCKRFVPASDITVSERVRILTTRCIK